MREFSSVLRRYSGERLASGLTLVRDQSSQSLWLTGKPVLSFISDSRIERFGRESLLPAGFSRRFRLLRDKDPQISPELSNEFFARRADVQISFVQGADGQGYRPRPAPGTTDEWCIHQVRHRSI